MPAFDFAPCDVGVHWSWAGDGDVGSTVEALVYAKVFAQIFDSSIASDWQVRHVFEDFLKLCDEDGVVDMTIDAIHRRTNVPIEIIHRAIESLEKPDLQSRSQIAEGRRIIRLDEHRTWGWMVVNYGYYRRLASEHQKRERTRDRVNKFREKQISQQEFNVTPCNALPVTERDAALLSSSASASSSVLGKGVQGEGITFPITLDVPEFRHWWGEWEAHRKEIKFPMTHRARQLGLADCEEWGVAVAIDRIKHAIKLRWRGLYPQRDNGAAGIRNDPPLWKKIEIIKGQIAKHPANHTWSGFDPNRLSETMKAALKEMREKLKELEAQQAAEVMK